jgi:gliding motility-associated-like protein
VNRSVTGAYLDTFVNYVGCDSIVTLNLLVNPTSAFVQNIALCDPATITIGSHTYSTSGTYIDTLTNRFGCDSVLTTNLTMHPIVFTTLNPVICEGTGFRVGVNLYSFSGSYQDTLRSMHGCDSIITTNLTVIPTVFSAQNFDLCLGESITVGTHTYSTDGIFSDTLGSITGCDSVVITSVTVHRPVTLIIDTSICKGNTYGGVPYTGDADMYDTIPSSIGCDSVYREVHIHILQDPALQVTRDVAICEGASTQLRASGGNGNYIWSPPIDLSCIDCADPIATPLNTTIYTVSSHNCNGNLIVANVQVSIQPAPIIDVLNQDTCVYMGQKIMLHAAVDTLVYASVSWSMGGQLLCTNCLTHIAQPLVNGFYYGVITDSVGCTSKDSFEVCVKTDCPDSTIEIPNFMSANNDGFNDVFTIKNPENLDIAVLRIFDRWGDLLYETTSSQPQWDGTIKGTPCTPGVYVYYVEGHCPMRSNFIKTGNVTILK